MDGTRFDSLARSLAAPRTRRGLLGSLAALGAGLLGARATDAQVTQAHCGNKVCAANPGVCTNGCVCCVYSNGNSRCRPPGECGSGTVVTPTTTTTTVPPTTTTTAPPATTTPAPTTTTTTTPHPFQGTCAPGADVCQDGVPGCNGSEHCRCGQLVGGGAVCRDNGQIFDCNDDGDCVAEFGLGQMCFDIQGCGAGTACAPPCPAETE